MNNPEIDDLYRIVIHDEDVAGLQVAVNHALFVRRLQTPARLCDDPHHTFQSESRAGALHELFEGRAGQERHDEERPSLVILLEVPGVQHVDDVWMTEVGEYGPFLVEQLQRGGAQRSAHALECDETLGCEVVGLVYDPHSPLTHRLAAELVTAVD